MSTVERSYYCHCDECCEKPLNERLLKQFAYRYHLRQNKFEGETYKKWRTTYNGKSAIRNTPVHYRRVVRSTAPTDQTEDTQTSSEVAEVDQSDPMDCTMDDVFDADVTDYVDATPDMMGFESQYLLPGYIPFSDKIPQSKFAKILSTMVTNLHNNNAPRSQTEAVMESLNQILEIHGDEYRFPKAIATFLGRSPLEAFSADGIKHHTVCPSCHQMSALVDEPKSQVVCHCPLQSAVYKPNVSKEFCQEELYKIEEKKLVPKMVYSYCSISKTIQKLFLRKGFAKQITDWKYRQNSMDYMFDLYDATGFLNFKTSPSELPFVQLSDYNLLLSMNIDWFSPFNTSHSVGCIYLTIMNLPKEKGRHLKKNMLLVGVIPGPKEPPTTAINYYLAPFIEEMKVLLEGVTMKMIMSDGSVQHNMVRACLFSVSSDLPATKKLAGSMSYNSSFGCHFCKTNFPRIEGSRNRRNYCNWDCEHWESRNAQETRNSSEAWKNAATSTEREILEKNSGVRYSILFELPYYSYGTLAIEPMHVLYLGVVKKALKVMLPKGSHLKIKKTMQEFIEFNPDASCAPFAKKIVKDGLPYTKAAEFKEFMTSVAEHVLSPPLLPASDYNLIMHLITALQLLDSNAIKMTDIEVAHNHLLAFARGFEQRFGPQAVTPNFHFMLHLRECIYKFGPMSCFWGFGFERNNLFIKNINTNHKPGFEKTYMHRMQSIIFSNDHDSVLYYTS